MRLSFIRPAWRDLAASIILLACVLVLFWPMATMRAVPHPQSILISDIYHTHLPTRVLLGQALRAGTLPHWTPLIYSGYPILSNPQTGAFYPLNWLYALLPWWMALNLGIVISVWLTGLGFYAYARAVGLPRAAGLVGGIAFMFSGFMVSHVRHLPFAHTVSWLPLGLAFFEWTVSRRRRSYLLGLAGVWALMLLAGAVPVAYLALLGSAAYIAARLLSRRSRPFGAATILPTSWLLSVAAATAGAALLALALAAVQYLPAWQMTALSARRGGLPYERATTPHYYLPDLLSFLYPFASGDPGRGSYRGPFPLCVFWESYGYVGITTVALAALACMATWRRHPITRLWAAFALGAGLLMVGRLTPLYGLAWKALPGLDHFRVPGRFVLWVDFALSALAAVGLSSLLAASSTRGRHLLAGTTLLLLLLDLWWFQRSQLPTVDALLWARPPAAAAAARRIAPQGRIYSPWARRMSLQAYIRGRGWQGSVIPYLEHREFIQASSNALWGLPSPAGSADLPDAATAQVWGSQLLPGLVAPFESADTRRPVTVEPATLAILSAWNVGALVSPVPLVSPALVLRSTIGSVWLYENTDVLPRVRIAPGLKSLPVPDTLSAWRQGRLDPRAVVALHGPAPRQQGGSGTARIVQDSGLHLVVETRCAAPAWLVVADTWHPAWRATLDGSRPIPIRRANVCQRAVQVPAGPHRITFSYDHRLFRLGLAISLAAAATWLALAAACLAGVRRRGPA